MVRRTTISHIRLRSGKMKASVAFVLCFVVGSSFAYYVQREAPYNVGPDDPFAVEVNQDFFHEPSQRLFWGNNGAGSNQVGGTGLWATLTNKFPFLGNMFGRMEMPSTQYGVPATLYGPPAYQSNFNQLPPQRQVYPQFFAQGVQPVRDVGFTDDAVIITPPQVPIAQPAPAPAPMRPLPPAPAPDASGSGYQYNKPQYRLELPHKR